MPVVEFDGRSDPICKLKRLFLILAYTYRGTEAIPTPSYFVGTFTRHVGYSPHHRHHYIRLS